MTFTAEDGTGIEAANGYASVAYVDEYHTDRGNTKWTGSSGVKQAAIIRASDYIDKRFGRKFRGYRNTKAQGLEWPRTNAVDNDGFYWSMEVPKQLKKACAEYALRALLLGELSPDPYSPVPGMNNATGSTVNTSIVTGEINKVKKKVGPIETEIGYRTSSEIAASMKGQIPSKSSVVSAYNIPEYPAADLFIEELLMSSNSRKLELG